MARIDRRQIEGCQEYLAFLLGTAWIWLHGGPGPSYIKQGYNSHKWPSKWVPRVITLLIGFMTPHIYIYN